MYTYLDWFVSIKLILGVKVASRNGRQCSIQVLHCKPGSLTSQTFAVMWGIYQGTREVSAKSFCEHKLLCDFTLHLTKPNQTNQAIILPSIWLFHLFVGAAKITSYFSIWWWHEVTSTQCYYPANEASLASECLLKRINPVGIYISAPGIYLHTPVAPVMRPHYWNSLTYTLVVPKLHLPHQI